MKINRESCELVCEVRGALVPTIVIDYGRSMCGDIVNGVGIAVGEGESAFVLKFADLEAAYLEAKNFRERHPMTNEEQMLARTLENLW